MPTKNPKAAKAVMPMVWPPAQRFRKVLRSFHKPQMTPRPLDDFTLFMKLPPEIRTMIWLLLCPPRVVQIDDISRQSPNDGIPRPLRSRTQTPAAFEICPDSWNLLRSCYPIVFEGHPSGSQFRFNFELDTLYIDWDRRSNAVALLRDSLSPMEKKLLKHVAIEDGDNDLWGNPVATDWPEYWKVLGDLGGAFPSLQTIEVATDAMIATSLPRRAQRLNQAGQLYWRNWTRRDKPLLRKYGPKARIENARGVELFQEFPEDHRVLDQKLEGVNDTDIENVLPREDDLIYDAAWMKEKNVRFVWSLRHVNYLKPVVKPSFDCGRWWDDFEDDFA